MNWYKKSQSSPKDMWGDLWGAFDDVSASPKIVKKDPPTFEEKTIIIYRGFNANVDRMKNTEGSLTLSPKKSEQGLIWFSTDFSYVIGRGRYILSYPLSVKDHYQKVYYDDGTSRKVTYGDDFENYIDKLGLQNNPYENSEYFNGIELPSGFFFSYKVQKHIVCNKELIINSNMLMDTRQYSKQEMLDSGADGYLSHASLMEIPIDKIDGLEPVPAGDYWEKREIKQPVEVIYDSTNDVYILYSGNHRVQQAKMNGQKTILAYVQF